MAADPALDESRTTVKTYVPAYQKERWSAQADELGMSQSEFVRSMVQAGRRGFTGNGLKPARESEPTDDGGGRSDESSNLEGRVLEVLADGQPRSWDALLEAVTDDIEGRLDRTLESLQAENRVMYSGRKKGYVLIGADER